MSIKVTRKEDESDEDLMKRFKHEVNRAGVMTECKKREFYLKKTLKRKQKRDLAKRERK
jgi:small subunit ribosomal protein S21